MMLAEKLERFRRGGQVTRYHTHMLHRPPNNAEHSYGVAIIADLIYQRAYNDTTPAALLLAALYHDQAEYETGDTPGWIKKRHPELKRVLKEIESEVEADLGIPGVASDELACLVKVADELEHLWTCLDERRLGNKTVDNMFPNGVARLKKLIEKTDGYTWTAAALEVLLHLASHYKGPDCWTCNSPELR